jgi:hypothetical protein
MGILRRQSTWSRVTKPLRKASTTSVVRSGLTAGATAVVLTAASAATSAIRRKQESG